MSHFHYFSFTDELCPDFLSLGMKPAAAVIGHPTIVNKITPESRVGYSGVYTTNRDEYIATIPLGYADGYCRKLGGRGYVIRNKTGMLKVTI